MQEKFKETLRVVSVLATVVGATYAGLSYHQEDKAPTIIVEVQPAQAPEQARTPEQPRRKPKGNKTRPVVRAQGDALKKQPQPAPTRTVKRPDVCETKYQRCMGRGCAFTGCRADCEFQRSACRAN